MPNLVSLLQLLHDHPEVDSGAEALFDADSVSVAPGPTPQQVVVYGRGGVSDSRKRTIARHVDELRTPNMREQPEDEEPSDKLAERPRPASRARAPRATKAASKP